MSCLYSIPADVGGAALITGETDGLGIDLTYHISTALQIKIIDTATPANNYAGAAQGKLTYTSPSVKLTRRASGTWTLTNGTTELPYEWNGAGWPQGLLIEEARTNFILRSAEADNASWTKGACVATSNTVAAPDGATTADTLTANAGTGSPNCFQATAGMANGSRHATSWFVKKGTHRYIQIGWIHDTSNWATSVFDLDGGGSAATQTGSSGTGVVNGSLQTDAGNGWYRLELYATLTSSTPIPQISFAPAATGNTFGAFSNTTITAAGTETFHVWGAQVELGNFATSQIATTTAQVTRAVDNISLPTSAFNLSATAGTLYVRFRPINVAAIRFAAVLDDGTANERIALGSSAAAAGSLSVIDGGAAQTAPLTAGTITAAVVNKTAASWAANDFALSTNGGAAATDVAGTLPTVTSLRFGTAASAVSPLNGHLQHIVHLPRAMSDAELQVRAA